MSKIRDLGAQKLRRARLFHGYSNKKIKKRTGGMGGIQPSWHDSCIASQFGMACFLHYCNLDAKLFFSCVGMEVAGGISYWDWHDSCKGELDWIILGRFSCKLVNLDAKTPHCDTVEELEGSWHRNCVYFWLLFGCFTFLTNIWECVRTFFLFFLKIELKSRLRTTDENNEPS